MAWFKVDDKFHSHPKVITAPLRAIGLWTKAGAWSSDQLTDGHVPRAILPILGANTADARALVACGLWVAEPDGWRFHDWLDQNPSREATLKRREEDRRRKAEARAALAAKREAQKEAEKGANLRAVE